jgi:hypothetical protein
LKAASSKNSRSKTSDVPMNSTYSVGGKTLSFKQPPAQHFPELSDSDGSLPEVGGEQGEQESFSDLQRTMLQSVGVPREDLDSYAQMSLGPDLDVTRIPSLPSTQILMTQSASDLPTFSGSIEEYREFKQDFLSLLSSFPESDRLRLLKKCLDANSKQAIAICQGAGAHAFAKAFAILDEKYDRPDLVKQILLQQITGLTSTRCAFDELQFAQVVRDMRERYDRLLMISPLSAMTFESAVYTWMGNMPSSVYNKLSKLMCFYPKQCTFQRALVEAERHVKHKECERRSPVERPSGENSSRKSASKRINTLGASKDQNGYSPPSESSDSPAQELEEQSDVSDQGRVEKSVNASNYKQAPKGSAYGNVSSNAASNSSAYKRKFHKCNLCDTDDHYTIDCKVKFSNKQLQQLVKGRRICWVCGDSGHWPDRCRVYHIAGSNALCQKPECGTQLHAKSGRFCALCKKP